MNSFPRLVAEGLISYPQPKIKKKSNISVETVRRIQADREAGMTFKALAAKYCMTISYAHKLTLEKIK